jgi:GT2 family glycosyltransferase/glycosyltransferase involved in cell wall biosynthesis
VTSVCFIVHGCVWPDEAAVEALRSLLRRVAPGAHLVEAREDRQTPRGAAHAINAAAAGSTAGTLVVLEPFATGTEQELAALVDAAARAAVVAAPPSVWRHEMRTDGPREDATLLGEIESAAADRARWHADAAARPIPAWGLPRRVFETAGGLDERLWSVGLLADLEARLPQPFTTIAASAAGVPNRPAWPLQPHVAQLLAVRNRLITAFKSRPPRELGVELAETAAVEIAHAWHGSGLSARDFHFGGTWGRGEGALARFIRPGAEGAARVSNHADVLVPLLALDSFLDAVPGLLDSRRGRTWVTRATSTDSTAPPAALPTGPDTAAAPAHSPRPRPEAPLPRVSVIVVNWNGLEHLTPCFSSLVASDYPADRLELVCVDNGSTDGSVAHLRQSFPRVAVVELPENRGFTGGNTAGVAAATGDVLVFLNNDMRVEPDAIRRLVGALDSSPAAVAARVLSWDGRYIDFVRGTLNFEGRGFQDFYGRPAADPAATSAETFFPNGGAFAVAREAFVTAGGFDDDFFAYYDDVDLGWRLRLMGVRIAVEDRAIVYHRHGATSRTQPEGQKRYLMERNGLVTLMKNYGEDALRHTLGAALLLAVRRVLDECRLAPRTPGLAALSPFSARVQAARLEAADLYTLGPQAAIEIGADALLGLPAESLGAVGVAIDAIPEIRAVRNAIQARRRTTDAEILPLFGRTFEAISPFSSYQAVQDGLVEALELERFFRARTRVLIITHEALAENMSGPAIRCLELGRALSSGARVTVAGPTAPGLRDERVTIAGYEPERPASLRRLAEEADVLLVQGFTLARFPFLTQLLVPIVVDLYCPFTIEHLEQTRGTGGVDQQAADVLGVQNAQLDVGDFFLCASEIQRDFWIGNLHCRGRINPRTYADDPTLRRLIDVVPFGLPADDIERWRGGAPVLKGVRPGIGPRDTLLLWGGSLLDWQDPLTLIDAVARLVPDRPDIKLFFMGTKHPNPLVAPMRVVGESEARARALGLLDTHVFFNDWVPYAERARYLIEADLGISTHREHLETHFSFRTRMLDYVWARLPIVCTRGDVFATLVEERGLGVAVPPGDPAALADAIRRLLEEPERRRAAVEHLGALAGELQWPRVTAPLARFCANPWHAPDRAEAVAGVHARLAGKYRLSKWLKRTALRAGLSEQRIEQVKRLAPVRALMSVRNQVALRRATKT